VERLAAVAEPAVAAVPSATWQPLQLVSSCDAASYSAESKTRLEDGQQCSSSSSSSNSDSSSSSVLTVEDAALVAWCLSQVPSAHTAALLPRLQQHCMRNVGQASPLGLCKVLGTFAACGSDQDQRALHQVVSYRAAQLAACGTQLTEADAHALQLVAVACSGVVLSCGDGSPARDAYTQGAPAAMAQAQAAGAAPPSPMLVPRRQSSVVTCMPWLCDA